MSITDEINNNEDFNLILYLISICGINIFNNDISA